MTVELLTAAAAASGLLLFYWQELTEVVAKARRKIDLYLNGFREEAGPAARPAAPGRRFAAGGVSASGSPAGGVSASGSSGRRAREKGRRAGPVEGLQRLLKITTGFGARRAALVFICGSAVLGAAALLLLKGRVGPLLAESAAAAAMLLPYAALFCRLQTIRIAGSHEGDVLVRELLDNYRLNYFNMQQAVEVTAVTVRDAENSRRLMLELAKGLNVAAGPADIRRLLRDMQYAIGTSWAGILADNMYFALVSGMRVENAMEDLAKTLVKARKVEEFARRENNESRLILKYLVPGFYAFTVLCGVKYFGLTPAEFVRYQFLNSAGLAWFTVAALCYALGLAAQKLLSRGRLDV